MTLTALVLVMSDKDNRFEVEELKSILNYHEVLIVGLAIITALFVFGGAWVGNHFPFSDASGLK